MNLVNIIQNSSGEELLFERVNEGANDTVSIIPAENEGNGRIGAQLQPNLPRRLSGRTAIRPRGSQ